MFTINTSKIEEHTIMNTIVQNMPEKQSAVESEIGEELLGCGARGYDKTIQYKIA